MATDTVNNLAACMFARWALKRAFIAIPCVAGFYDSDFVLIGVEP